MDLGKVDTIIKFALAAASQEDFESRELGPIHLVKYVYLADLAYSQRHKGKTYTGTPWRFHHFGPWATEAYLRIKPAVEEIGAKEKKISSPKYEDDFYRWSIDDEELYDQLHAMLPLEVSTAIKSAIHSFGNDTAELLHYVYKTRPMLQAAPGENLCFEISEEEATLPEDGDIESGSQKSALTVREKRQRKAVIEQLRETMQARLEVKVSTRKKSPKYTPPRYDEVYFEGLKWLDRLAGEPIKSEEGVLEVSGEIWKSPFRTRDDLP